MGLSRGAKPGARAHLLSYGWPGNVRELEHAIHRAVVLARATRSGDEVVIRAILRCMMKPHCCDAGIPERQSRKSARSDGGVSASDDHRALEQNNRWAACARALEMDVANLHRLAKRLGLKG
jgi:anaerobic nitric oxide reductase transcription regulator